MAMQVAKPKTLNRKSTAQASVCEPGLLEGCLDFRILGFRI